MIIILAALTGIGIYLMTKDLTEGWLIMTFISTAIIGIWLLGHTISILTASYSYEMFVVKRDAFESTLNNARKNGNEYETAAIVKSVAEWNIYLAMAKYENKTLYFDQFIDDRIEGLEPIK